MLYDDDSAMFRAALFLQDYSWIYNFKVTNLLSDNIIDRIPEQWVTFLTSIQLDRFNEVFLGSGEPINDLPTAIANFIRKYRSISLPIEQSDCRGVYNVIIRSPKDSVLF